jgi:hypothetical protein
MSDDICPDGILSGEIRPDDVVTIEPSGAEGLLLRDCLQRNEITVICENHTGFEPASTEPFPYPVDAAVATWASELTIPNEPLLDIAAPDGTLVASAREGAARLGSGEFFICAQVSVRIYIRVFGPIEACSYESNDRDDREDKTRIQFPDTDENSLHRVVIGVRSDHKLPPGTVTTPAHPEPLMQALSTFGPSLNLETPQRSFPSLRTRPPRLSVGDSLDLAGFEQASGAEIAVPATMPAVVSAAPLAYYANARVVPTLGDPVFNVGGEQHTFSPVGEGYSQEIAWLLRSLVALDIFARERSKYRFVTDAGQSIGGSIIARRCDYDLSEIAEQPLHERLATYLSIPEEQYEHSIPIAESTFHIADMDAGIPALSRAAYRICPVRATDEFHMEGSGQTTGTAGGTEALFRESSIRSSDASETDSSGDAQPQQSELDFCRVTETDSRNEVLVSQGDKIATNATTHTPPAVDAVVKPAPRDGPLRLAVVCTDERMAEELAIADEYETWTREVDLDVANGVTKAELRSMLTDEYDYFHYIGHARSGGLQCSDGWLDTHTLEKSNARVAVLNACRSLKQGLGLIEAGTAGVIATRRRVENDAALQVGKQLAHLMWSGYTLQAAYRLVSRVSDTAEDYLPLGAGILSVAEEHTPQHIEVERAGDDLFRVIPRFPFRPRLMMGGCRFFIGETPVELATAIFGGHQPGFVTDSDGLNDWCFHGDIPILYEGEIHWARDLIEQLRGEFVPRGAK